MLQVLVSLLLLCVCILAAPSLPQTNSQLSPQQRASDLDCTPITSVTDDDRFMTNNPDADLVALAKVKHAKGNIVFSSGDRIPGDKLLVNNYDDESFTNAVDIEAILKYLSASGRTLTRVEVYVDSSSGDADAYFTDGGIGKGKANILLESRLTRTFSYEAFFYGY